MVTSRICRGVALSTALFVLRPPGQAHVTPYSIRKLERVSPGLDNEYLRARRADGALVPRTHPTEKSAARNKAWKLVIPAEFKTNIIAEAVEMISTCYSPRNVGNAFAQLNCEDHIIG